MSDTQQVWVRNEKGKMWGPLAPSTLELLIDSGAMEGRIQISTDGINFVLPGRLPYIRMAVPRTLWGDVVLPGDDLNTAEQGAGAAVAVQPAEASSASVVPMAGPGAQANAVARHVVAHSGPGVRAQMDRRPLTIGTDAAPGEARPGSSPANPVVPGGVPGAPVMRPGSSPANPAVQRTSSVPGNPAAQGNVPGPPVARTSSAPGNPVAQGTVPGPPVARAASAPGNPVARSTVPGPPVARTASAPGNPVAHSTVPGPPVARTASAPGNPVAQGSVPGPPVGRTVSAQGNPVAGVPDATVSPVPTDWSMPTAEIPPAGELSKHSPIHLYYLAASNDSNGLLTLALPDRSVSIHFRKGNPEFVDSTHAEDALSTFLVKQQLATFDQLGKAEAEKARFGGELIGALFGLGLLNPATAFTQLAQRASSILLRVLVADSGTFTWELKELAAHKSMPLGNRWSVLAEQIRKIPTAEVRRRLSDAIDMPVMKSGGRVSTADLRLTPQETRALSYFDGVRSLNQLIAQLPNEADTVVRVAFLLRELEAVAFAAVKLPPPSAPAGAPIPAIAPSVAAPVATRPVAAAGAPNAAAPKAAAQARQPSSPSVKPVTPVPGAARPAPTTGARPAAGPAPAQKPVPSAPPAAPLPGSSGNVETDIKELQALVAKMKEQNHFDVLSVKKDAPAAEVKLAYFKLAKAFHPDTVAPGAPELLGKLKAEIFGRIGDANRTLSDDKLRAEYLAEIESGRAGEKIDVVQLLLAEEQFQKACLMVKARRFAEAVKLLDEAIQNNAEEAEFFAWRGYAKFFAAPEKKAAFNEAMKDISVCLKRNEKVAAAWYFQGHMAKLLGDNFGAKKYFQRCVEINPEYIDAQRELRMMK